MLFTRVKKADTINMAGNAASPGAKEDATMPPALSPTTQARRQHQSDEARRRNRRLFRVSRIENGYLVTEGDGEPAAAMSRADVHRRLDDFFDSIEAKG